MPSGIVSTCNTAMRRPSEQSSGLISDSRDWGEQGGGGNHGTFEADATDYGLTADGEPALQALGANHMGVYQTDMVQLEVMHAYLDFTIPNTPVRSPQVFSGDDRAGACG